MQLSTLARICFLLDRYVNVSVGRFFDDPSCRDLLKQTSGDHGVTLVSLTVFKAARSPSKQFLVQAVHRMNTAGNAQSADSETSNMRESAPFGQWLPLLRDLHE
mgnify:FL=1